MVEIVGPDRMRVQVDATEINYPGKLSRVAQDDLVRRAPGGKAQLDSLDPVGSRLGRALLEEELALRSVDETLQRHRPSPNAPQHPVLHGEVVANEIQLGVSGVREEHLVRIADGNLSPRDLDYLPAGRHASNDTLRGPLASVAMLSSDHPRIH